LPSKPCFIC